MLIDNGENECRHTDAPPADCPTNVTWVRAKVTVLECKDSMANVHLIWKARNFSRELSSYIRTVLHKV